MGPVKSVSVAVATNRQALQASGDGTATFSRMLSACPSRTASSLSSVSLASLAACTTSTDIGATKFTL